MPFCNTCGTPIADGATICVACAGRGAVTQPPASSNTAGMTDNISGMLAYATFIPAIVFLVIEPYNKNRFVRFHSFQCIFLCLAAFVIHFALGVVGVIPFLIFLTLPLHRLVSVATIAILIFLALKANQNQMYKFPVIGDMAEKQANAL
jgi:uncharacterized membrane protein